MTEPDVVVAPLTRSALLSRYPKIVFGMSTRSGGVSRELYGMNLSFNVNDDPPNVRANRARFFGAVGIQETRIAFQGQVHGNTVMRVYRPGMYEKSDALVTSEPDLYLAVSIADCVPIFLYDPVERAVAAVHSGWRGSKLMILRKAIEKLTGEFNSKASNLVAYIGPSAGGCCYEVGEEVASEFGEQFVVRSEGRKPRLDLKACNKSIMLECGVTEANIEVSGDCTICKPELYHSYRRDGNRSGRMLGVVGMR